MGRTPTDNGGGGGRLLVLLLLIAFVCCALVYTSFSSAFFRSSSYTGNNLNRVVAVGGEAEEATDCCRGREGFELWGEAVKWGSDHKVNTSIECCQACKAMCYDDGPCLCDSWVFCGDRSRCGDKFGECWLKKQKHALHPDVVRSGQEVIWTSGVIFGKGEGIVGLETNFGILNIKLLPDCAPHSVAYVSELLGSRHCAGCRFYRAEGRGISWDSEGNHIADASLGPPYALVQGTLEAEGIPFNPIPKEACPTIKRGSVAWIGSGPEFFISLVNHVEWRRQYTIFAYVLPENMEIVEKIAQLSTRAEVWGNINVSVLEEPIRVKLKLVTSANDDLILNSSSKEP